MEKYKTQQGKNFDRLGKVTDSFFKQLQNKTGRELDYEEELFWKKLFDEKILLHVDEFFSEMSIETGITYHRPVFLEELKKNITS